jgi:hypothetical protein
MNSFIKGMGSLNLFPLPKTGKTSSETAWQRVVHAFARTGANMQSAIDALSTQIQVPTVSEPDGHAGK